jgi:outer membrane protein assembly factor BamB
MSTIYVSDANGELATVNTRTHAVHDIGNMGVAMTDIAFAPDNQLYGISYSELYSINPNNGQATAIGPLGGGDYGMNALAIDAAGHAYGYSNDTDRLYSINLNTGHARAESAQSGHESAGDLAFFRGRLLFSDSQDQLLTLNPSNGAVEHKVADHIYDLYGLIATDPSHLYGFSGTTMYALNPGTGGHVAVAHLGGDGLGQIYGAAYDGYFTHV